MTSERARTGGAGLLCVLALLVSGCGATDDPKPAASPTQRNGAGTSGDDHLTGTAGDDTLDGLDGSDVIRGLDGDDVINGGEANGSDTLIGGPGNDIIRLVNQGSVDAGPGDDLVRGVYLFEPSTVDCGPGNDRLFLTDGTRRTVRVTGCETVVTTPVD